MKEFALAIVLVLLGASQNEAMALDVPYGGDALYHQVRNAKQVGVGTLAAVAADRLSFKGVTALQGTLPATLEVATDEYVRTLKLVPGRTYVLFLVQSAAGGTFDPAVTMHSIVEVTPAQVPAYRQALPIFQKALTDKAGARAPLVQMARTSRVPYLQYSALAGLHATHQLTKEDVPLLRRVLQQPPAARDARAQSLAVRELARLGGEEQAAVLVMVIRDPNATVSAKSFAIDSLFRMKGAKGLEPVLGDIDRGKSLRLKKEVHRLVSKQPGTPQED